MIRKINIRKTIMVSVLIYFTFSIVSQEVIIYRVKEKARIQTTELNNAKKENVKLTDRVELLRSNSDAYFEKLARDMQYIREGESIIVDEQSKK